MRTAVRPCVIVLSVNVIAACTAAQSNEPGLRPPGAEPVDDYLARNTIYLYWDANFGGGDPHRIHPVTQHPPGRPQNFEDQKFVRSIRDDMSSLKWNLPPGVIAVFYEDAAGKGEQASLAYRLRMLFLDRWNLWPRLTHYRTWRGPAGETIDGTNNASERAIGWRIKERYRTMRGYKRPKSAVNVSRLLA